MDKNFDIEKVLEKFMDTFNLGIKIFNNDVREYSYFSHQSWGTVRHCSFILKVINNSTNETEYSFIVYWALRGKNHIEVMNYDELTRFDSGILILLESFKENIKKYLIELTKQHALNWFKALPSSFF